MNNYVLFAVDMFGEQRDPYREKVQCNTDDSAEIVLRHICGGEKYLVVFSQAKSWRDLNWTSGNTIKVLTPRTGKGLFARGGSVSIRHTPYPSRHPHVGVLHVYIWEMHDDQDDRIPDREPDNIRYINFCGYV